ncbi:MAG: glycosyl transferase family 1 [Beggiatoa sp. IS2]|nr:MAG: glycosyl transferase family 1 [Beggiatoa sp. IS2]
MKTIILHDYFESAEGGGRLSSVLAQGLHADLAYGFARPHHPFVQGADHQPTERDLKAYSALPLWRQFKLTQAFIHRTHFLKDYHTVIYSGFYTPLAVLQHLSGPNILYCHTPPRFIYDQRDFYLNSLSPWLRPALQAFIHYLQPRYENAITQMTTIVANSENVRKRIRYYLGQESIVVYPPCDTHRFTWRGQGHYYLSTARLDPLKRVDLIVQAFLQMPDKHLIITSGGSELLRLRKLARYASHIHFTGWIDDLQLADLIGNAIATLYLPKDEDFGMSPLESMSAGKPVIGVAEGGLLETIIERETGLLLSPPPTVSAICEAVLTLTPQYALTLRQACEQQAHRFRTERFLREMRNMIKNKLID